VERSKKAFLMDLGQINHTYHITSQLGVDKMKKWKKLFIMTCALSVLMAMAVGCAGKTTKADANKPKVIVVLKTLSSPYWKYVQAGAEKAFQDFGVDGTVIGPSSESQVIEQVNMIENALSQNPKALVVAPTQPSTAIPVFERYKQAGIRVKPLLSVQIT
jgi:ribose transport system substrate-binding protein